MSKTPLKIIAVLGPTATGKTDLAIEIAKRHDVSLISMDSALVYKDMNIGTAKPDPLTLEKFPHALVDIVSPEQTYSANNFVNDAKRCIQSAQQSNKIAVLVGGTMLYFNALLHGLDALPQADKAIRKRLQVQLADEGSKALHDYLATIDAKSASKIHQNDPQRIIRAIEVFELTGDPLSELQQQVHNAKPSPYDCLKIILLPKDRAVLHDRIAKRFKNMIEMGFIQEVKTLRRQYNLTEQLPAMRAVGYRQAWQHLDQQLTHDEFIEKGIIATRQLAKRQHTWLRKEENSHEFFIEDNFFDAALHLVSDFISKL